MLAHKDVGFRTFIILKLGGGLLPLLHTSLWVLYLNYFIVDQTHAVIDVIVLIGCVRHVVSLHAKCENVMT